MPTLVNNNVVNVKVYKRFIIVICSFIILSILSIDLTFGSDNSDHFVIKLNLPASEIDTETRVMVKSVNADLKVLLFHLEQPFCRVEKEAVSHNDMESLVWAFGAEHIYTNESVTLTGKESAVFNDARIAGGNKMVMIANEGNIVGVNRLNGWQINSNPDYPLTFKVVKDIGYVYMCGQGEVVSPSGEIYELGNDDTPEKLVSSLESNDFLVRETAVQALGWLGNIDTIPVLAKALNDPVSLVRRSVVESLGRIGNENVIYALEIASRDKHSWTAETSKWLLNQYKLPEVDPTPSSEPTPPPEQKHMISAITIYPKSPVHPGQRVKVECKISNPESDSFIYHWESNKSYFSFENTINSVNYWNAPFEKGDYKIVVSVNNESGGISKKEMIITVNAPDYDKDFGNYWLQSSFKNPVFNKKKIQISDVDFDSNDNMYILDVLGDCIHVFDKSLKYIKTLCAGELIDTNEFLVENDKIYVIFKNNKYLKRYDLDGNIDIDYGTIKENKKFIIRKPVAMSIGEEGELYVIDRAKNSINVFEKDGSFRLSFISKKKDPNRLKNPISISTDGEGNIYVYDTVKNQILSYNTQLQFQRSTKFENKIRVVDACFDKIERCFYFADLLTNKILKIDLSANIVSKFGSIKKNYKIVMDNYRNFYVVNKRMSYVSKLVKVNDKYELYGKFGTNPFTSNIKSITTDMEGSLFLLDKMKKEIIKIDRNGWEVDRFGKGTTGIAFSKPEIIISGMRGQRLYVLDKIKKQIFQFSNTGKLLGNVNYKNENKVTQVHDIASDIKGNLYMLDKNRATCLVYDQNCKFISQFGEKTSNSNIDDKFLAKPKKISVGQIAKHIFVYDYKAECIKKYGMVETCCNFLCSFKLKSLMKKPILDVNNYGQIMVSSSFSNGEYNNIDVLNKDGNVIRTLKGKKVFGKVRDIEIDNIDNVYIINKSGHVYVYKQAGLIP